MGSFVMPLLTSIMTVKIGFTEAQAGVMLTVAVATQAPFLLLGGKLADRFGSKKVIVIFQAAGALMYLICAFLPPGMAVAVLIILAADLISVAAPGLNAIVAEVTPTEKVKNAYSLVYLGSNLGMAVGPAIGGFLFKTHLDLLFFIDGLTLLLATALVLFMVSGSKTRPSGGEAAGTDSADTLSVFGLLRQRPYLVVFSVILLVYNFCYVQWNFLLQLQMADIFKDAGGGLYSLLFSINAITVTILTPLLTSLTQHLTPTKAIFIGGLFFAAAFGIFVFSSSMPLFIGGVLVMTIGEILMTYNSNSYIALRTPQSHLSRANSLLTIVNGTGLALGPVVMGGMLSMITIPGAWMLVSGLMAVGALVMLAFHRYDSRKTA
jgi:MFS family permease